MASTVYTTGGASGNISTAQRDTAYGYFTAGNVINDSHLTYLKDRINSVCGHTHSLTDYTVQHTYGDIGSSASAGDNTASAGTDAVMSVATGNVITATHHNTLRTAVNSVRSHSHGWTDN